MTDSPVILKHCEERGTDDEETFECTNCGRIVGVCQGGYADDASADDWCAECWCAEFDEDEDEDEEEGA